jgi:two-component system CheB/CheR fusion protein
MGQDGTAGILSIKMNGDTVIIQDPSTCESPSMPLHAIRTNMVDHVVRVEQIQDIIQSIIKSRTGTI